MFLNYAGIIVSSLNDLLTTCLVMYPMMLVPYTKLLYLMILIFVVATSMLVLASAFVFRPVVQNIFNSKVRTFGILFPCFQKFNFI